MAVPFWDTTDANLAVPPGYVGATYMTNPWDTLTIGGSQVPGLVEVTARPGRRVDNRKQSGKHGSSPILHGYEPAEVSIRVSLWTPAQFAAFQPILATLWPRPGKNPPPAAAPGAGPPPGAAGPAQPASPTASSGTGAQQAFDVSHPALDALGIRSVIVLGPETPTKGGVSGERVFVIKCREFLPPPPHNAVQKVTGSKAKVAEPYRDSSQPPVPPVQQPGADYSPANCAQGPPSSSPAAVNP